MFCLFDEVFIDLDINLNKADNHYILISPIAGDGFLPERRGNQLLSHRSYSEFLKAYFPDDSASTTSMVQSADAEDKAYLFDFDTAVSQDSENNEELSAQELVAHERRFWYFLLNFPKKQRLVLYLEASLFDEILIKYLAAVYTKGPVPLVYKIYELTHFKYNFYLAQLNRGSPDVEQELGALPLLEEKDFEEAFWAPHGFRNLKGEELKRLPMEFLLASHLVEDQAKTKEIISEELRRICVGFAYGEIAGLKRDLLRNYLVLGKIFPSLSKWDPMEKDSLERVGEFEPKLKFLSDFDFNAQHLDKVRHYGEDLYWVYETYYTYMKEYADLIRETVKTVLADPGFDPIQILEKDIAAGAGSFIFGTGLSERIINPYLVTYIYELYRKNDPLLQGLKLEIG